MAQFENALTIINFKNPTVDLRKVFSSAIIDSTKQSIIGLLSDVVSSVGIVTNTLALGYISEIAQQILSLEGINEDNLDFYQFKINPTNFTFPRQKIMSNVLTGGGWDSDVRGQNMVNVSYSATTGSLVPKTINNVIQGLVRDLISRTSTLTQQIAGTASNGLRNVSPKYNDLVYQMTTNPKLSSRYIKFLLFDKFWRYNDDDLLVVWEDNAYIGKFMSFDFRPDANKPWEIQYNFSIAVYPDFTYNIYTGAITNDLARIKRRFNISDNILFTTLSPDDPENLIESNFNWYRENGEKEYNKKVEDFTKNNSININEDNSKLSPEDLSKAYRTSKGDFIDIFEEYGSLKTKLKAVTNQTSLNTTPSQQSNVTFNQVSTETEINAGGLIG